MNNFAIPGLNSDDENYFDFEAASSDNFWPSTRNSLVQHTPRDQDDESTHTMTLTHFEKEAVLAARASNVQDDNQSCYLMPPELPRHTTNLFGAEESGPSLDYDQAGIPLAPNFTNFVDFDAPHCGNTKFNALDAFRAFEQPQLEKPAEKIGALTDSAL
ncbi:hypothetical protein MMC26_000433 [Xylographa opegraphella]|nr:hypothetical protein [Xylographa opegraphella]